MLMDIATVHAIKDVLVVWGAFALIAYINGQYVKALYPVKRERDQ